MKELFSPEDVARLLNNANLIDEASAFQGATQKPQEVYSITLNLATAALRSQAFKVSFPFRSVFVESASDPTANVNMLINDFSDDQAPFLLQQRDSFALPRRINNAYFFWSAQSGKTITLKFFLTGEFKSGSYNSVSAGGVNINEGSSFNDSITTLVAATTTSILAQNFNRKVASIQNKTGASIYVGDSTITNSTFVIQQLNLPNYAEFKDNIDQINMMLNSINNRQIYKCLHASSYSVRQKIDMPAIVKKVLQTHKDEKLELELSKKFK
jgi:hypothetical protein